MTQTDVLDEIKTDVMTTGDAQDGLAAPPVVSELAVVESATTDARMEATPASPTEVDAPVVTQGYIDHLCRLDPHWIVLHGWFPGAAGSVRVVVLDADGNVRDVEQNSQAVCVAYRRPDVPIADELAGKVMVAFVPGGLGENETFGILVESQTRPMTLGPAVWKSVELDPATFAARLLPLAVETRDQFRSVLLELVAHSGAAVESTAARNDGLAQIHDTLRQRLERPEPGRATNGLLVESLVAKSDRTFFVTGWMWCDDAPLVQLTAVSPEGFRVELLQNVVTYNRPDIEQLYGIGPAGHFSRRPGFATTFELPAGFATSATLGWTLELLDGRGVTIEAPCPRIARSVPLFAEAIVTFLERVQTEEGFETGLRGKIGAELRAARAELSSAVRVVDRAQFGSPATPSAVTLILLVDGDVHSVEHQLAAFAADPAAGTFEIVYVLNHGPNDTAVKRTLAQLHGLYRVAFCVIFLSTAPTQLDRYRVALSEAHADVSLLGHSSVLPPRAGWFAAMHEVLKSSPDIGAVTPTLVSENGSVTHAGFDVERVGSKSEIVESFSGQPQEFLSSDGPLRDVQAATLNWLLVDRTSLSGLGELSSDFQASRFASVDVGRRLRTTGRRIVHAPGVVVFETSVNSTDHAARAIDMKIDQFTFDNTSAKLS